MGQLLGTEKTPVTCRPKLPCLAAPKQQTNAKRRLAGRAGVRAPRAGREPCLLGLRSQLMSTGSSFPGRGYTCTQMAPSVPYTRTSHAATRHLSSKQELRLVNKLTKQPQLPGRGECFFGATLAAATTVPPVDTTPPTPLFVKAMHFSHETFNNRIDTTKGDP